MDRPRAKGVVQRNYSDVPTPIDSVHISTHPAQPKRRSVMRLRDSFAGRSRSLGIDERVTREDWQSVGILPGQSAIIPPTPLREPRSRKSTAQDFMKVKRNQPQCNKSQRSAKANDLERPAHVPVSGNVDQSKRHKMRNNVPTEDVVTFVHSTESTAQAKLPTVRRMTRRQSEGTLCDGSEKQLRYARSNSPIKSIESGEYVNSQHPLRTKALVVKSLGGRKSMNTRADKFLPTASKNVSGSPLPLHATGRALNRYTTPLRSVEPTVHGPPTRHKSAPVVTGLSRDHRDAERVSEVAKKQRMLRGDQGKKMPDPSKVAVTKSNPLQEVAHCVVIPDVTDDDIETSPDEQSTTTRVAKQQKAVSPSRDNSHSHVEVYMKRSSRQSIFADALCMPRSRTSIEAKEIPDGKTVRRLTILSPVAEDEGAQAVDVPRMPTAADDEAEAPSPKGAERRRPSPSDLMDLKIPATKKRQAAVGMDTEAKEQSRVADAFATLPSFGGTTDAIVKILSQIDLNAPIKDNYTTVVAKGLTQRGGKLAQWMHRFFLRFNHVRKTLQTTVYGNPDLSQAVERFLRAVRGIGHLYIWWRLADLEDQSRVLEKHPRGVPTNVMGEKVIQNSVPDLAYYRCGFFFARGLTRKLKEGSEKMLNVTNVTRQCAGGDFDEEKENELLRSCWLKLRSSQNSLKEKIANTHKSILRREREARKCLDLYMILDAETEACQEELDIDTRRQALLLRSARLRVMSASTSETTGVGTSTTDVTPMRIADVKKVEEVITSTTRESPAELTPTKELAAIRLLQGMASPREAFAFNTPASILALDTWYSGRAMSEMSPGEISSLTTTPRPRLSVIKVD